MLLIPTLWHSTFPGSVSNFEIAHRAHPVQYYFNAQVWFQLFKFFLIMQDIASLEFAQHNFTVSVSSIGDCGRVVSEGAVVVVLSSGAAAHVLLTHLFPGSSLSTSILAVVYYYAPKSTNP